MAVDSKLIQEVNEKRFNPWLKVSSRSQDGWIKEGLDPSLSLDIPDIPGITKIRITDSEVWLGIDIGHSPDPTSVAVVKHLRLTSTYREGRNSQEFITSFYRIVRCKEWSGVSYPDQRGLVQEVLSEELNYHKSVSIVCDGTGVGKAVGQDWQSGLTGYYQFLPVTMVYGEPRSLNSMSVSDLILNTQAAFEQGRVAIPRSNNDFAIRKLYSQLTTRGIETDFRGRLRAIDERKSGLNHYDLSVALSLVVGHNERITSSYQPFKWVF